MTIIKQKNLMEIEGNLIIQWEDSSYTLEFKNGMEVVGADLKADLYDVAELISKRANKDKYFLAEKIEKYFF